MHCGLQRVAVIGLGRTARLKVPTLDEFRSDGAVVRPHAIDAVRAMARHTYPKHSVHGVSEGCLPPEARRPPEASSRSVLDVGAWCEVDASEILAGFFTIPERTEHIPPGASRGR